MWFCLECAMHIKALMESEDSESTAEYTKRRYKDGLKL